ncbi:MAG: LPS export ABC transporter periplasmic protein LptC [Nitrospinae bacterium]|nr:LPS export ABC transporter periplasmic protein LptC [Nitrospinota bacterium]
MRALLLALIAGVAGFTLWWLLANGPEETPDGPGIPAPVQNGAGGISLGEIRIVERRESRILFELMASSASISDDQTDASLFMFSLLAYPEGGEPLTIVANVGELRNNRTEIAAKGNVLVTDGQGRALLTESMVMYGRGERFETDDRVRALGPNFVITGVGMVAYPARKTVELKSDVTAVFMPENQ